MKDSTPLNIHHSSFNLMSNAITRRELLGLALVSPLAAAWSSVARRKASVEADWSKSVVESEIKRYPTAESFKGWGYAKSLYLYGEYLVYLRTKERRYLEHIKDWVDLHVDEQGNINRPINALDYMLPGNLLLILYKETGQEKYKLAADQIRHTLDTYPRTKDGGCWHADTESRERQRWAARAF